MPRRPTAILRARFVLEHLLTVVPSGCGRQIDLISEVLPMGGGGSGGSVERLLVEWADAQRLTRDLSPELLAICRLRYAPQPAPSLRQVDKARRLGGQPHQVEPYTREIGEHRLLDALQFEAEEWVRNPEGQPLPGFVTVSGIRARYPSHREIAERLGGEWTERKVRRALGEAAQHVRDRQEAEDGDGAEEKP